MVKKDFEAWVTERHELGIINDKSLENYKSLTAHFMAKFEDVSACDISSKDVTRFYVERLKLASPNTIRITHQILKSFFADLQKEGKITVSPMIEAKPPKKTAGERKALDDEQIKALMSYAATRPFLSLVVHLAISTGMRRGEMAALRWSDVDLKNGRIYIRRSRIKVGSSEIEKEPKSEAGIRTVVIPETLISFLCDKVRHDDMPVLVTAHGQRPSLAYISNVIKEAMRAIGCDDGYCLHSTRHTHATHLLKANMPIKAVSKRLGHSDISITMRTYAKVLDNDDAELASAINRIIDQADQGQHQ